MNCVKEMSLAAKTGDLESIMLRSGFGMDAKFVSANCWAPLRLAAEHGHENIVNWILDSFDGVDDAALRLGMMRAVGNGHVAIAADLVDEIGENGRCTDEFADAVEWGFLRATEKGLEEAAIFSLKFFDPWRKHKRNANLDGEALLTSARSGMTEIVKMVVELRPSESIENKSVLLRAMSQAARNGHHSTICVFLEMGFSFSDIKEMGVFGVKYPERVEHAILSAKSMMESNVLLGKMSSLEDRQSKGFGL